ncbi:MAG TPA: LytTR family DNA-binding domain-containing protein [Longimicrobiaceae bacterium]|nr:LytTR family DNA-binding domain-containing protein [Longimicrobiaceae bacterium]
MTPGGAMEPVRTLIVDDEPLARTGVAAMLRGDPEVAVVGECADGREAVRAIDAMRPDLVLLDVQMPELDGFGVVREVGPERMPVVVFLTAFDRYALQAFEAHALDYVLKPFTDARFHAAIGRAKEQVRQRRMGALGDRLVALMGGAPVLPAAPRPVSRILVRETGRVTFVRVEEIDWIEAQDYYARLHVGGRAHLVRETLQELEAQLDPGRFVRVHRSAIVALDRVREVRPDFAGRYVIVLVDGTRVPLSRRRREAFERALGQSL